MTQLSKLGLLLSLLLLAGCATRSDCSLNPAAAFPGRSIEVASLECGASRGDRSAQLALGILYEEGAGVPQDLPRAAQLYRIASTFTSGTLYIWSPQVGRSPGRIVPLRTGNDQPGLPDAAYRLALLKLAGRGTELDIEGAKQLLRRAAEQGVDAAKTKLLELP